MPTRRPRGRGARLPTYLGRRRGRGACRSQCMQKIEESSVRRRFKLLPRNLGILKLYLSTTALENDKGHEILQQLDLSELSANFNATPSALSPDWHGTTIVCVRKNGRVCMMGDGMVSMGNVIVKPNAKKIRRIYPKTVGGSSLSEDKDSEDSENEGTIVGFAGTTADAFTLLDRLEGKLDEYPGQLARSCVELAKG
ncbi:hypothetical protein THAOC_05171, partial [Thalassiosira oceanica]